MSLVQSLVLYCLLGVVKNSGAGSNPYHRTTSLDELKEIDSYVATGLPLFDHGFFVQTANGPILVKAGDGGNLNKPRLNPGYYSTLPRLIPTGYEGIAISHFNLGSSIPSQIPSIYSDLQTFNPSNQPEPHLSLRSSNQFHRPRAYHPSEQQQQQQSQTRHQQVVQHHVPSDIQRRHDQSFQRGSPLAQGTFQISNFLNAENEDVPTSYQNMMISHQQPTRSQGLTKNPIVEQAFDFDDTLPAHLRNSFYKNPAIASALARESLPVEGETIVGEWDTNSIQKTRIQDLLRDAGFLR